MQSQKQNNINTTYDQNFYCNLTINDIPLIPGNIISLVVREWVLELVPRLHLVFQDDGLFSEINTIQDLDVIKVELARNPEAPKESMFSGEFCVIDWKCNLMGDNRLHLIELTALLNSPLLYAPIKTRSFRNKNSSDVLSSIAKESNLKFNKRNNFSANTDTMTWLQINQSNSEFIRHVTQRAFKNDDLILTYCDCNKNLNITSLNTELDKIEEISGKYNLDKFSSNVLDTTDSKVLWYASYDYINTNGYLNKIINYELDANYYDLSDNKVLKMKNDDHKLSELSFKNKEFEGKMSDQEYYGIQSSNVHSNYVKAQLQNKYLSSNFFGFSLVINAHASVKVNLMDTVMLSVPSLPYLDPNSFNELLTGRYLVGGIIYIIGKNQGFQKHISLHRNGFNKSLYQKSYNVTVNEYNTFTNNLKDIFNKYQ